MLFFPLECLALLSWCDWPKKISWHPTRRTVVCHHTIWTSLVFSRGAIFTQTATDGVLKFSLILSPLLNNRSGFFEENASVSALSALSVVLTLKHYRFDTTALRFDPVFRCDPCVRFYRGKMKMSKLIQWTNWNGTITLPNIKLRHTAWHLMTCGEFVMPLMLSGEQNEWG